LAPSTFPESTTPIVFIVGGGSTTPHYLFIAAVEVACLLAIIWKALRWPVLEPKTAAA